MRPLAHPPPATIDAVIRRRGSARAFARRPIELDALSTMLHAATRGIPFDDGRDGMALAEPYLIVNAVDGLAAGTYAFDRQALALATLARGDFRTVAGHLDLGQELAADAAVDVYLLADLAHCSPPATAATAPRNSRRRSPAASSTSPPTRSASAPPG